MTENNEHVFLCELRLDGGLGVGGGPGGPNSVKCCTGRAVTQIVTSANIIILALLY